MEDVIIEYLEDFEESEKVAVLPIDLETKEIVGPALEVLTREEAHEKYSIVGYLVNGELNLDEDYEDDTDYYEEFGIEKED